MNEKVLEAMITAGIPLNVSEVAKILDADKKEVEKAFAALKKSGKITSPVRCKWEPAS